jgi:hypothetical protein
MAAVRTGDVLFHVGGRALRRYGTVQWRRWEKEVGAYVFTRAAPPALAYGPDGNVYDYAADALRIHYPTGLLGPDGLPLGGPLFENTRQNRDENGDFEADAVGVGALAGGGTPARVTSQFRHGLASCQFTTTASADSGPVFLKRDGLRMAVTAARRYTFSLDLLPHTDALGHTFNARVAFYDSVGGGLGEVGADAFVLPASQLWTRYTTTVLAPAGAVTASPFLRHSTSTVASIFMDLVQFEEGAYASVPIPTGTAAVTRGDEGFDMPVTVDMGIDWTVFLWFLAHHGNVASWPETEPQLDPFMFGLYPTSPGADANDSLRLHRQNAAAQYEWEFGNNLNTATRSFTVTPNPQKLVLRHHASDHHLDAAIDGGGFAAGTAPSGVTYRPLVLLRLGKNTAFSAQTGNWTLFDCLGARGLHTQAEMEAY